jgi:uncharacterized protein (DUF849 family)
MADGPPVILEVALNGVTGPERNPASPRLPEEIAADALRCLAAGASIVHTHTHEPARDAAGAAALYLEAYERVLAERPDALLYPTIGLGRTVEERYGHHEHLARAGAIRIGLVDTGSVNLGELAPDGRPDRFDFVYVNGPRDVDHMMEACRRLGLGPSVACFEPGFLRAVVSYVEAGRLPAGTLVKLYFTERGYFAGGAPLFGVPPVLEALTLYLAMLRGTELPWAVAVIGCSLLDSPLAEAALARGGHLRVGLEDEPGAEGNAALVARARALCERHGRRLATPAEAARILGLPERAAGAGAAA